MNKNRFYRSMFKFSYNNKRFELFENTYGNIAILNINERGKYEFPEIDDLVNIYTRIKTRNPDIRSIEDDRKKHKQVNFIPKVIVGSALVTVSAGLIMQYVSNNNKDYQEGKKIVNEYENNDLTNLPTPTDATKNNYNNNNSDYDKKDYTRDYEIEEEDLIDYSEESITVTNNNDYIYDPKEFYKPLNPVDDELDYLWGSDYREYKGKIACHDSQAYNEIFEVAHPNYEQLCKAVDANNNIGDKYKTFIKTYIKDWLNLWPDSDFSIFYQNLKDLKIVECTEKEMHNVALSLTAVAAYRQRDNTVFVNQNIDLSSKSSEGYIELAHELSHANRCVEFYENDTSYSLSFGMYCSPYMYAEEAIITDAVYEMQGLNKKSVYYTLLCNYYRIMMDCLGENYTPADFTKHSVNYLAKEIGDYMDFDASYSFYLMRKMEYQFLLKGDNYVRYDISSFQDLYDFITEMYMKKYLHEGMSRDEAEIVFNNLVSEVTSNLTLTTKDYSEINESCFRPKFEELCIKKGIYVENKVEVTPSYPTIDEEPVDEVNEVEEVSKSHVH